MTPLPSPNSSEPSAPDRWARLLGAAGLIPFVGLCILLWGTDPARHAALAQALVTYAALIASFLGGIHWGLVMRGAPRRSLHLAWGVTPSLLGWTCLLLPLPAGLVAGAATLALCLAVDVRLWPALGLRSWLPLRTGLTVTAVTTCLLGAAGLVR